MSLGSTDPAPLQPLRPLPVGFADEYRLASSGLVRSWSFGAVKSGNKAAAAAWAARRGTLGDEAIFGPARDFECACGRFRGKRYEHMICDKCGVKITTADCRRMRFAHIELPTPVQHPFGASTDELAAFPVIPAALFESIGGGRLADAYGALVAASTGQSRPGVLEIVKEIVAILLPIAVEAHAWNLQDAGTLARGLALERSDAFEAPDARCTECGYALGGLAVASCPGCSRQLRK